MFPLVSRPVLKVWRLQLLDEVGVQPIPDVVARVTRTRIAKGSELPRFAVQRDERTFRARVNALDLGH
jgi:hypothetical protein